MLLELDTTLKKESIVKERPLIILALCLILALTFTEAAATARDWPQFRGPWQNGAVTGSGLFDGDHEGVGLEIAWKRPLGSGYSSISIVGGRGVTMFTDGTDDLLTAFDVATGKELWRYRVAEMYKGHSGSDDGPISTPTVRDGVVYGLGPLGHLFAVKLEDGEELWRRTLDGEKDSLAPEYGFSTAPAIVGDLLIVQTGGPAGHSVTAFDRGSGKPRWSTADDPVNYQSPVVLELAGSQQVVAINDKLLLGLNPASGEVLWKHEHGTSAIEAFAQPLDLGQGRLLINSVSEVVSFRVTAGKGGNFSVQELWRSNVLKNSYAVPVVHEGYVYGFNAAFLSCLDAETGEVAWKSRPPGGEGLILVDGQLLIVAPKGDLVVVQASPEGYSETARLPVFTGGSATAPSAAGGLIFVRDLKEMAAIRVIDAPIKEKAP